MRADGLDSADWGAIVARLGGEESLAASAREYGAFTRAREVRSASDLLRLAFRYGPGGLSLRSLASTASADGVCHLSDVALLKRLIGTKDWLSALCRDVLARGASAAGPSSVSARPIRIVDSSRLEGPGQRAWRLHLSFDPVACRVADARITGLDQGERLDRLPPQAGAIYLADRGYPQPDGLHGLIEAGADVLVRLTWNSLRLRDEEGRALDWFALFAEAHAKGGIDMKVTVRKPRGKFAPLPMRLIVMPKPPDNAARARAIAAKASRKDQRKRANPLTLAAADHLVLITSLPAEAFPIDRLTALYRLRWQIELAFKRMKSLLRIDRLPAKSDALSSAWLHAHLLFALLVDAELVESGAFPP
jgi:Transposase DDE domain